MMRQGSWPALDADYSRLRIRIRALKAGDNDLAVASIR
jgi:hypothetical protein